MNTQIHETNPSKIILSIQYKPIFKYPRFFNESAFLAFWSIIGYNWWPPLKLRNIVRRKDATQKCIVKSKTPYTMCYHYILYRTTVSIYTKKGLGRISILEISEAQRTVCWLVRNALHQPFRDKPFKFCSRFFFFLILHRFPRGVPPSADS